MKILFISTAPLEYSASSNMRNIALLKGLIENTHEIYTLTPEAQKDSKLYDSTLCDLNIKKKYFIEMSALRTKISMKKNKRNILKEYIYNILKKFKIYDFRSSLANKTINIEEKFDLIISSSDPKSSHLVTENLIKNNPNITKKWIQYWGDPFANDINNKGFVPTFLIKNEEERVISQADAVIYVSPFTLEKQKDIYPTCSERMFFLPIPYQEKIIYDKIDKESIVLGYFGDYYLRNRNIFPLYRAMQNMEEKNLYICGNSDIQLEEKGNVIVKTRQNIRKIREMEAESDILICVCNKKGTQIPGKIYHYAATNKPILIILDGEYKKELRKYFETFNRYEICENTEEDIVEAINKIINEKKEYEPSKQLEGKYIAEQLIYKIKEA